jgi:small subunit ribosomal protein S1
MSEKRPPGSDDGGEDFAAMFAEYEREHGGGKRQRGPRVGDTVRGRVVSVGADSAFVDLGGKAEGALDLSDARDAEGRPTVAVGDEVEARVVGAEEGQILLRRTLGHGKQAHAELQQAFELGVPVEGLVTAVNKGGLEVQVAGARAFCPISQIDARHVEDAAAFVGQRLQFRITRYESAGRGRENIVLSRRALLEEEQRARAAETQKKLVVGAVLDGTVRTIKDYGAFVDLGGIEGMLHVSELGFQRVASPRDVLAEGQALTVQIIKIEKSADPRKHDKISLSLKSLQADPWRDAAARFPEGTKLAGTVVRVEPFGAFVEIAPGLEGLVHVSEMGGGRGAQARNLARVGQGVEVRVLAVDADKKRISLSMEAAPEPLEEMPEAGRAPAKSFGTLGDLLKGGGPQKKRK